MQAKRHNSPAAPSPSLFKRARLWAGKRIAGVSSTPSKSGSRRGLFDGASMGRLTNDWISDASSADRAAQGSLETLRNRNRSLERNNDYFRRYLHEMDSNILGAAGIVLQNRARDVNGKLDKGANDAIEDGWKEFCKPKNFTVTGSTSARKAQRLILRSAIRDGGCLIRKVKGWDNPFKFSLQLMEIDLLDFRYEKILPNGNIIKYGVEKDEWGRVVNYYLHAKHPGDYSFDGKHIIVPGNEIIHVYLEERIGQSVGTPWAISAMRKLFMLDKYEETELVAARVAAAKMGFYIPKTPNDWDGDMDDEGDLMMEMEPGMFEELPFGMDFKEFNPTHPGAAFEGFRKAMLRGIASALSISYNFLASDLEGVNYTSLRAGVMDEREGFKMVQQWFIESVFDEIYPEWLESSFIYGYFKLPLTKLWKFDKPQWIARRWGWVDPTKEVDAAVIAINNRLKSRTQVVEESGDTSGDFEDLCAATLEENELMEKYKVPIVLPAPAASAPPAKKKEIDPEG